MPPDATNPNTAPPDATDDMDDSASLIEPKSEKSCRGVFKTKTITNCRSKDPCTFKCSVCGKQSPTLWELNVEMVFLKRHGFLQLMKNGSL